jgi:hypothetical protein
MGTSVTLKNLDRKKKQILFIVYCNDQMLQYLNCHDIAEILLKVALNTIKQTI